MAHCFTYGSLMCEDIFTLVTGLQMSAQPAILAGHSRHPVIGTDYPGIRRADHGRVSGMVYLHVPPAGLARLDDFEGSEYLREAVQVSLADGSTVEAWVYVFHPDQASRLAEGDWDFDHFLAEGKARFLQRHPPAPL